MNIWYGGIVNKGGIKKWERDIKVECEWISWFVHDDGEMIYINEMLK